MSVFASETFESKEFLKTLTHQPGVYRMIDAQQNLLYVGKAKDLKKRVSTYFSKSLKSPRIRSMMEQVASVQVTVTGTEAEALLMENTFIKEHRPKYNILLRDDKSYPYIFVSTQHKYPRISFYRGARKAKGAYYGPYASIGAVRETLNLLQKVFRVRQCRDSFFNNRSRPCLQYQINRCTAPCVNLISEQQYRQDIDLACAFLSGKSQQVIDELVAAMERSSEALEFEQAAVLRDQIEALRQVAQQQYVNDTDGDCDVIACRNNEKIACVQVFSIRNGMNLGNRTFYPKIPPETTINALLTAFIGQYYLARTPPSQVIVAPKPSDECTLAEMLSIKRGRKVTLQTSVRGRRAKWLEIARRNVDATFASRLATHVGMEQRYAALEELLRLDSPIERMECFDISHTQGELTVASCVVFNREGPLKSDYRKFNIENIQAGDDYAAMRQALLRHYTRLKRGEGRLPDILFIDGGKGQLQQAREIMEELQIDTVLLVGVAKGPQRRAGDEQLFKDGAKTALLPGADSIALHLVQQIRDEAHRFAITGHRKRRQKARNTSILEQIAGLGPKRRQNLLKYFGGLRGVLRASEEELAKVPGISHQLASDIYYGLHGD